MMTTQPPVTTSNPLATYAACIFEPSDWLEIRRLPARRSSWCRAKDLPALMARFKSENADGQNIYVGVNPRREAGKGCDAKECATRGPCGRCRHCVALARVLIVDFDGIGIEAVSGRIERAGLPVPTLLVATGHGVHAGWRLAEPMTDLGAWTQMQKDLIALVGSDPSIHDPPRIMRLPGFLNVKQEPFVPCEIVEADPSRIYGLAELRAVIPHVEPSLPTPAETTEAASRGLDVLARAAAYLSRIPGAVEGQNGDHHTFKTAAKLVVDFALTVDQAMPLMRAWNETCLPPWTEEELRQKVENAAEYGKNARGCKAEAMPAPARHPASGANGMAGGLSSLNSHISQPAPPVEPVGPAISPWPDTLDEAAFHGLAGEMTRAIEPHTEADPVALLTQALAAFGNAAGRNSYVLADGARHYPNLFVVLTGSSSKGRKGTSWSHICRLMASADPAWEENRLASGMSSGEGLIWAVRDPIYRTEQVKEKGRVTGETQQVLVDAGIDDKRLMVIESEFAQVLRVLQRDSNILSATIRQAWDTGVLRTLTKNSPARATGAHISIVGHVTSDELVRYLDRTETANGFANRFLWFCVRRSKCLPEGGRISSVDFGDMLRRLGEALDFAREPRELHRDPDAREMWHAVYPELSEGRPGLAGAMLARGEAQVMRLAMVYALLDCSTEIRIEHLQAALALWEYCEASVEHIFGDAIGDDVADEIVRAMRRQPEGMNRTDLHNLFGKHQSAARINRAMATLAGLGLVHCTQEPTAGRPEERWFLRNGSAKEAKKAK